MPGSWPRCARSCRGCAPSSVASSGPSRLREMIKKRLDELKMTGALPSPTGVGLAILDLTRAEDYSMTEITRVISSDPALTGRIIRLANSATCGTNEVITTVQDAALRLGIRAVTNLALGFHSCLNARPMSNPIPR